MSQHHLALSFYIGWDVGGWNCDKHGKSLAALQMWFANLSRCYSGEIADKFFRNSF